MPAKLTVAKIVSTATPMAWSQAYHAGGFTAILSISQKEGVEEPVEESELHKIGKELLDTLIAEYFTLVTKNLDTVKAAVEASTEKLPEGIILSMVVGASVKNVLYIVVVNHGKAILKRGEKAGVLLEIANEGDKEQVESVSGYLEENDLVVLETKEFEDVLPQHELLASIDHQHPADLAEILSPRIHEAQNGGASAIIFSYHEEEPSVLEKSFTPTPHEEEKKEEHQKFLIHEQGEDKEEDRELAMDEERQPPQEPEDEEAKETETKSKENEEEEATESFSQPQPFSSRITTPQYSGKRSISHSQRIFMTIAVIIAIVLASSIFFFLSKQEEAKRQETFNAVYQPAKTKYEEGVGLMDLNKSLALSDMQQAKDMVTSGENKLPKDSPQYKQLQGLLSQINGSIQTANQMNTVETNKAAETASPLLTFAAKHTDALYIAQDDTNFYTGDASGITQYIKSSGKSKQLVKNVSDWKSLGGLGAYLGNVYVLDKSGGILKYVGGTSKSAYFASGVSPDLTTAVSLAIDGSIWVLKSDGTILKFTKGKQDTFTLSGLDKPLSSPSTIVTSVDDDNVYVLDKGSNRLVVLKKTGEFVNQYQAGIIKNAEGLDVDEKGKKAYILSSGTVYELDMK